MYVLLLALMLWLDFSHFGENQLVSFIIPVRSLKYYYFYAHFKSHYTNSPVALTAKINIVFIKVSFISFFKWHFLIYVSL